MEDIKRNIVMHYRKAIELEKVDDKKETIEKVQVYTQILFWFELF